MTKIEISGNNCVRCGICGETCPMGIIGTDDLGFPATKQGREGGCIACGHCVAVCPYGALSIGDIKSIGCPPFRDELVPSLEQSEHLVRSRRSVRVYRKDRVPRETISKLLDLVRYAPTGSNSQLVRWTVVDSPTEVRHLAEMVIEYLEDIRMAGDVNSPRYRFVSLIDEWKQGRDRIFRDAPSILLAHAPASYGLAAVDCSIALSYLDLITPSFDLGTCWAGIFMNAFAQWEPLRKAVGLPDGDFCFGAIMLGFPRYHYHRLPPRKEAIVSWK